MYCFQTEFVNFVVDRKTGGKIETDFATFPTTAMTEV